MKNSKLLTVISVLFLMFNVSSCSKYEDGPRFSLRTKESRLTKEWELVELKYVSGVSHFSPDYSYYGIKFLENQKLVVNTKSVLGGLNSSIGEWYWSDGKNYIGVDLANGYNSYNSWYILRLTKNELWIEDEYFNEWHFEVVK